MLLAVDVGNTNTVLGLFDGQELFESYRIKTDARVTADELALMFRNTFQPRFYRRLHRYVHRNYRTHIAVAQLRQVFAKPNTVNIALFKKAVSALYNLPALWIDRLRLQHLQKPLNG